MTVESALADWTTKGHAPLAARLCLSAVYVYSGICKFVDIQAGVTEVTGLGLPAPGLFLALTILVQLGCGLMIFVGFWTRLAAFLLLGLPMRSLRADHNSPCASASSVPAQRVRHLTPPWGPKSSSTFCHASAVAPSAAAHVDRCTLSLNRPRPTAAVCQLIGSALTKDFTPHVSRKVALKGSVLDCVKVGAPFVVIRHCPLHASPVHNEASSPPPGMLRSRFRQQEVRAAVEDCPTQRRHLRADSVVQAMLRLPARRITKGCWRCCVRQDCQRSLTAAARKDR